MKSFISLTKFSLILLFVLFVAAVFGGNRINHAARKQGSSTAKEEVNATRIAHIDKKEALEKRLKQRLAKTGEKPADRSKPAAPAVEDPAKEKTEREEVKKLLREYREGKKAEIEKQIRDQAGDREFQDQIKAIAEAKAKDKANDENKNTKKSIRELNKDVAGDFFEGDIQLNLEQAKHLVGKKEAKSKNSRRKRAALMVPAVFPVSRWPNAYVPYSFDPSITSDVRTIIDGAIDEYNLKTCLWFEENPSVSQRMVFKNVEKGCHCAMGRQSSGATSCNIGPGCDTIDTVIHEMGHGIGTYHEHNRWDRDNYVRVNVAVVNASMGPDWVYWFNMTDDKTKETAYGFRYDYRSIMHYDSFLYNGQPAFVSKIAPQQWADSLGASWLSTFHDNRVINQHYCGDWCDPSTSASCYWGGYPDPYDCSRCICPAPATGDDCWATDMELGGTQGYAPSGVPNTCQGEYLWATSQWTYLNGTIGANGGWPDPIDGREAAWCHWLIWTDEGRKIVTEVLIVGDDCEQQCRNGFTSVRVDLDWGKPEPRLCCKSNLGSSGVLSITSQDEHTIYSLYALQSKQRFSLRFKMV